MIQRKNLCFGGAGAAERRRTKKWGKFIGAFVLEFVVVVVVVWGWGGRGKRRVILGSEWERRKECWRTKMLLFLFL